MNEPDLIPLFIAPIERAGTRYMITGGVASIVYGEPRLTRDIDLIVAREPAPILRWLGEFPPAEFYVPPNETVRTEIARSSGGHFNVIHLDTILRADVYPQGEDPLRAWAFPNRQRITLAGLEAWFAPPEYVILQKLRYWKEGGSAKHPSDIRAMLDVSGEMIDRDAITSWANRLELTREWESVAAD